MGRMHHLPNACNQRFALDSQYVKRANHTGRHFYLNEEIERIKWQKDEARLKQVLRGEALLAYLPSRSIRATSRLLSSLLPCPILSSNSFPPISR
jgi:hypothetical protein